MSDHTELDSVIKVNSYIVIQRQGFLKLHQLSAKTEVMLGKDKIDLSSVINKPFWTMFKMNPCKGSKREFTLEVCSQTPDISEGIFKELTSGLDNRHITDDGSSQSLTSDDINEMREIGLPAQTILGKIIQNSKTFKDKTEYSQEKYLKKKEKKYFDYIVIRKPSLRLLADIFYSRDQLKVLSLRHDVLSQIYTFANVQHDGVYALFENGTQGLVGAGILNRLSNNGLLINLTIGKQPQKQAILAMNYESEKLHQFVSVQIKNLFNSSDHKDEKFHSESIDEKVIHENQETVEPFAVKRKHSNNESECWKKPRWAEDLDRALTATKENNFNAIIIVAKEYPLNLLTKLLPSLKASCPLVLYSCYREPLVQLYVELKRRKDVIGLHLTENWLRCYQILPERTHPDINMNSTGYLLTGIKVLIT